MLQGAPRCARHDPLQGAPGCARHDPNCIGVATLIQNGSFLHWGRHPNVKGLVGQIWKTQNLILNGFQNPRENLPQRAHLEHFGLRRVWGYFVAPLCIRVATLISDPKECQYRLRLQPWSEKVPKSIRVLTPIQERGAKSIRVATLIQKGAKIAEGGNPDPKRCGKCLGYRPWPEKASKSIRMATLIQTGTKID